MYRLPICQTLEGLRIAQISDIQVGPTIKQAYLELRCCAWREHL
jgi:hypothetical protein